MFRQVRPWISIFLAGALAGGAALAASNPQDPKTKRWKEFRKTRTDDRKAERTKFTEERKSALKERKLEHKADMKDRKQSMLKQRADRKTSLLKQRGDRKALVKDRLKKRKLIRQKPREPREQANRTRSLRIQRRPVGDIRA